MNIAGNITGPTSFNLISSDTVKLTSTQNSTKAVCFDGYNFRPDASAGDNVHDCGTSNRRWNDIYATNSSIQTSDKNQKKEIKNSSLGLGFLNLLTPREYKWKGGTRKHYGLVAQEVEKVLTDNNIDFDLTFLRDTPAFHPHTPLIYILHSYYKVFRCIIINHKINFS